jgi:hypothetical protein
MLSNTNASAAQSSQNEFEALRRFAPVIKADERCELCSLQIGERHRHLLEMSARTIVCACDSCGILFSDQSAAKYKRIPRDVKSIESIQLDDCTWNMLGIPIGLAFFFYQTFNKSDELQPATEKVVALYPSPAGATECLLDLSAWQEIEDANRWLHDMQPDVEALVVNRLREPHRYYVAPIDRCYELVGLIRMNWKGLSGGQEVWRKIEEFFQSLGHESRKH